MILVNTIAGEQQICSTHLMCLNVCSKAYFELLYSVEHKLAISTYDSHIENCCWGLDVLEAFADVVELEC